MNNYLERIAEEWSERAGEMAQWAMQRMVNRTDLWGRYLKPNHRGEGGSNKAITAPFKKERGKIFLQTSSLAKHFKVKSAGGNLGLHSASKDGTSRWCAIDIDLHDDEDMSVTKEGNYVAAIAWRNRLVEMGFDPLLMDSNGQGGFHLLVIFARAMKTKSVHQFVTNFVRDYQKQGLDRRPDIFPGTSEKRHGGWLRLPGRHHTKPHYTRVWNDEPWAEEKIWLEGHEAIDRILDVVPASEQVLQAANMRVKLQTICLDFDGVIHSNASGWQGEAVISDPPIHKVSQAIAELRKNYRVVVYSARCRSEEGVDAIRAWLAKHSIAVDEVCQHKPPAHVYVDDRAVCFQGDWAQTIADIHNFRR